MKESIQRIIDYTLRDLNMYSEDAALLVYRTGMAESGFRHLEQIKGPAVGFFQVEPDTINDTIDNYLKFRPKRLNHLVKHGLDLEEPVMSVLSSIYLQIAFCRYKYWRSPDPIPNGLVKQAKYWKKIYNGPGKGTVEHFVDANPEEDVFSMARYIK
tara:strand:- start:1110 stop:1577 length:468 start_codon:yes stop_codon:yes gene_type:complete